MISQDINNNWHVHELPFFMQVSIKMGFRFDKFLLHFHIELVEISSLL